MKKLLAVLSMLLLPLAARAGVSITDGQYTVVSNSFVASSYTLTATDPHGKTLSVTASGLSGGQTVAINACCLNSGYQAHGGLKFWTSLAPAPLQSCTVTNVDANNPLAAVVSNCTLTGLFEMDSGKTYESVPVYFAYNVSATFDTNGVGTFTLTPDNTGYNSFAFAAGLPVPPIASLRATFEQLLLALY